MKIISLKLTIVIISILGLTSFSIFSKESYVASGVYGVCNGGDDNSNDLELALNSDHTFNYTNKVHSGGTISIAGTWEQTGNKILLKNFDSKSILKDKWVLVAGEKCIKSRKGFEWTRLCLIKPCK